MYTQFFGNFLLNKGIITTEQLLDALKLQSETRIKLGTLAIHAGYMTANEVDSIIIMQTHQDKRFGELAVEGGYLTEEQLADLLAQQVPDYLLLGQILIEKGILSNSEFENLIIDYQSENEIYNIDPYPAQNDELQKMLLKFCDFKSERLSSHAKAYFQLLFNNLIRFIGDDFSLLSPMPCAEYPSTYSAMQKITGPTSIISVLDIDEETAVSFASRYVDETFTDFDEYVRASIEDFLNLHNGLFIVNMSNDFSEDLTLEPPEVHKMNILPIEKNNTYLLPVIYPFGTLHFLFSIK